MGFFFNKLSEREIISVQKCNRFLYIDFVFCIFTSFVYSNKVYLVEPLGFYIDICIYITLMLYISSANSHSFTSFLPVWMSFTSFSCLLDLVRASNTVLNESGESGHPFLVPDLRGNAFNFSPFSIILAVGLSYMAFIMLR